MDAELGRRTLEPGDVVQIGPTIGNKAFQYCFLTVDEVRPWGVQGYAQGVGGTRDTRGDIYPIRVNWIDLEFVGHATWVQES